jgi:hypothetical protein
MKLDFRVSFLSTFKIRWRSMGEPENVAMGYFTYMAPWKIRQNLKFGLR